MTCFGTSVTRDMENLREDLGNLEELSCLRVIKGTGRFYYLSPLLDEEEEKVEFGRRCLKWQEAWKSGDYNSFSSLSSWIGKKMEEKEWIGRSRKNIASFFSLVLKTPVSENMDPKELKNFLEQKSRSLLSSPSEDSRINSMIRFIEEHYREDITISTVASFLEISEGYLSRVFKKETDYTFTNYLAYYRMQMAMNLLKDCRVKVYEVADQVGYSDTAYFSAQFKKILGVSPSEYQDRCR